MTALQITELVRRINADATDESAAEQLWNVYYSRLISVARRRLGNQPKRIADEDDVAQSAMNSFFRAAADGRLEGVKNRNELWKVLLTITIRKANRHKERAMAQKRGGDLVSGESGFHHGTAGDPNNLADVPDERFVDDLIIECKDQIAALPNDSLREIAVLRLEGYSVEEIAEMKSVANSTVKRKLARIREVWSEQS